MKPLHKVIMLIKNAHFAKFRFLLAPYGASRICGLAQIKISSKRIIFSKHADLCNGLLMRIFLIFFTSFAFACTDFVVIAKDGSFVNGRSLEFATDLKSEIRVFVRNQKIVSASPNQGQGISWMTKYGYLGITCLGLDFTMDGMNEVGLSCGYLWLPNITEYPNVSTQDAKKTLDFIHLCDWALGNFRTVDEVKEALSGISVWGHPVPPLGFAPVHVAFHDVNGDNLVVEFVGGVMKIYDNPISIMTNSPSFDWQLTNLQNYLGLDPNNPSSISFRGVNFTVPGQGQGFLGLPGDWTPPSRFVKIFTLLRFVKDAANSLAAVNLAEHLLNSVDIPLGAVRDPGKDTGDYTQWVVIKDMSQKVFYFRSYQDLALKKIDMKQLNFGKEIKNSLPINVKKGYFDVTETLGSKKSMTVMH